jgi:hypothetical protein
LAKPRTRRGGRSAYREEFYRDVTPSNKPKSISARAAEAARRRRKASIFVPLFGLSFVLCVIAVAGSSAMIWLRKLGTLFGVEWSGDG